MKHPLPESASVTAVLDSTLSCPACGSRIRPKTGDGCVFCSCGSVPCPPKQAEAGCCA